MAVPVHRRDRDAFLSHAHVDHQFVNSMYEWLTKAGLNIWYDDREMSAGDSIRTGLQAAIEGSRGVLLVASKEAVKSGWVQDELDIAHVEHNDSGGEFRIIPLRLADAPVVNLTKGLSWIDVAGTSFDPATALRVIRAFTPGKKLKDPATCKDIYVSASWHGDDATSAHAVCGYLADEVGFRLVGDSKDQAAFDNGERMGRIMSSCGGFVSVIPFRGAEEAFEGDGKYKYFLREVDLAASQGLPRVVIADPRVKRRGGGDSAWLRMETSSAECPPEIRQSLDDLWDEWREPAERHYVFCALDLESKAASPNSDIRQIVARVTGMPTVVGDEIEGDRKELREAIQNSVTGATLVLADITGDNVNTCIEAGMARAAGCNVRLMSFGEPRRPPFMLRGLQMQFYSDELEQLARAHKIARDFRRRILNAEL